MQTMQVLHNVGKVDVMVGGSELPMGELNYVAQSLMKDVKVISGYYTRLATCLMSNIPCLPEISREKATIWMNCCTGSRIPCWN